MSASVFPAYVGMSPIGEPLPGGVIRVPRIRGDEPRNSLRRTGLPECSPHTWG